MQEQLQVGAGEVAGEHLQTSVRYLTVLTVTHGLAGSRSPKLKKLNSNRERDNGSV